MQKIAVDFFTDLFSQPDLKDIRITIPWFFPTIDKVRFDETIKPVSLLEVKSALFSIGGLKAPGHDGFPAIFFSNTIGICILLKISKLCMMLLVQVSSLLV